MAFKYAIWLYFLCASFILSAQSEGNSGYVREEIETRLNNMNLVIPPQFVSAVEGYIKGYTIINREKSERILGRTILYFPLYEKLLAQNQMPDDLKYLSVVESALNPRALSRVGAGGLWQFMPETGKFYGLEISELVDERCDPEKSTKAAIEYLKRQYARYGDWALAIAAYNSGPGRVNSAIKRARSKNFWRLSRYLPRETRNYVPAFIGAAYLLNYYEEHGLQPQVLPLDMQLTETTLVYQSLSFYTLAKVTGLALDVIQELNPAYIADFIPETLSGNPVTLPKRVMGALNDFLNLVHPDPQNHPVLQSVPVYATNPSFINPDEDYFKSIYTVGEGDKLGDLASLFGQSVANLKYWNNLKSDTLVANQELVFYQPREYRRFKWISEEDIPQGIPAPNLKTLHPQNAQVEELPFLSAEPEDGLYLRHTLQKGESLIDLVRRFPGNTLSEIMKLNGLSMENLPFPGQKIKLKKF